MPYETYYSPDRSQRLVIEYEGTPLNPRTDWDNATRMWCEHRNYLLGDQDDPKADLVEAIEDVAKEEGVNLEDEYLPCPECGGACASYDNAMEDYPAEATKEVDVVIRLGDVEKELTGPAGAFDKDAITYWSPVCDHCDDDGEVENPDYNELDSPAEIRRALERVDPDEEHIFHSPLYLYDHSGLTMNTRGFHCPWDSGQVGVIFITRKKVIEEGMWGATAEMSVEELRKLGHKSMEGDVETYDQYLRGDIYGFRLEKLRPKPDDWDAEEWADVDEHWEEEDSCWGFYGSDPLKNGMVEHIEGWRAVFEKTTPEEEY